MKNSILQRILAISLVFVLVLTGLMIPTNTDKSKAAVGDNSRLEKVVYKPLSLGSVKATGWLKNQLELQAKYLTGEMKKYNNYNAATSGWLGTSGESWENGPYFVRGLVALAYELEDESLMQEAESWMDAAINSQRSDGFYGPLSNTDWWPRMPMLMAIIDYYNALGRLNNTKAVVNADGDTTSINDIEGISDKQKKILNFMYKYFNYQRNTLPGNRLTSWAAARGGDNIYSVYWLYDELLSYGYKESQITWLIELGDTLYSQTEPWVTRYNEENVRYHVVNTSQGLKTPSLIYRKNKDIISKAAFEHGFFNWNLDHGRIDSLPNSDEAPEYNKSTTGTETCGVVESLLSSEITMGVLGEGWIGDNMEMIAYNSLASCYSEDYSAHCYFTLQNQVAATEGFHEFDCDHGDSSAFSLPSGFDCCYANNGMGWPKFVQNMWMSSEDDGLAVITYGPNQVSTKNSAGKTISFTEETNYPFEDSMTITYTGETASFPLSLRIPEWTTTPTITVNGQAETGIVNGEFKKITREWKNGDKVVVTFPSEFEITTWYNDSKAVKKGPLYYSLKIEEDYRVTHDNEVRELKVNTPIQEVYAKSKWNYALVLDKTKKDYGFTVVKNDAVYAKTGENFSTEKEARNYNIFSIDNAPVVIKAKGQLIEDWQMDGNLCGPQPYSGVKYDASKVEDIELIPYGCERLKITHFPVAYTDNSNIITDKVVRTKADSHKIKRHNDAGDEVEYQEFDNIVVPAANNYNLKVTGSGNGKVTVNGKSINDIDLTSGTATLNNLASLSGLNGGFKFTNDIYNNLRFENVDVESIEIELVNRKITDINVGATSRNGSTIKLFTNLNSQETPYWVEYGTKSGNYTTEVRGFSSSTATLEGLNADTTYYAVVKAFIMGEVKTSKEFVFAPKQEEGLQPNPNAANAVYSGFNTENYLKQDWDLIGTKGNVTIQANEEAGEKLTKIRFEKDTNVKAVLNTSAAENWSDYVVEARLSVDKCDTNNCGIMLHTSNYGDGPDAYNGYFVGIGKVGSVGSGIIVGKVNGSWSTVEEIPWTINPGVKYNLKVVAYGDQYAVYVDDEFAYKFTDSSYATGTVGLRSYNEAFTAYNLTVRNVEASDLAVFADNSQTEEVTVNFSDNFASSSNWTVVGDNVAQFNNNELYLGESSNIKASAGDTNWSDYSYEIEMALGNGGGNAGIIFRADNIASGPDSYKGYYFGLKNDGYVIGKADNNWTGISEANYTFANTPTHKLKVLCQGNKIAFLIDGTVVESITDSSFKKGKIGLRGYQKAYSVYSAKAANLTDAEKKLLNTPMTPKPMKIEASEFYGGAMIKYYKLSAAKNYKILVGEKSGKYTKEFTDVFTNPYKGGGIFNADKVAINGLSKGTHYIKMLGFSGGSVVAESNEIVLEVKDSNFTARPGFPDEPVTPGVKKATVLTGTAAYTKVAGAKTFNLGIKTNGDGKLSFNSNNPKVATVDAKGNIRVIAPGKAVITVSAAATANFNQATKTVTITVNPKQMGKLTVSSKKTKTLTVKWKKLSGISGYEILLAKDKKFKKGKKTVVISKGKTTSTTVKKLTKKTTYYVKARAFVKVGKTKLYGAYSKVAKKKIK
ncbi:MAG: glycoside hydrolase family 127 protein [Lachnospiraceae bacterium]|nr:glycoside hydrolase family 127 protein [Lachnospiraceae bacterium]